MGPQASETWLFGRVQDLAVDRRGHVYVLDASDRTIRVFAPDGRLLRVIGRVGRGPGEFNRPRVVQVVNDTLWVIDNFNARLSGFSTASGKLVQSRRGAVYDQSTLGASTGGIFIAAPDGFRDPSKGNPVTLRFHHEGADGGKRKMIASVVMTQPPLVFRTYVGDSRQPSGDATVRQPLDNGWLHAAAPHGRSIWLLDRSPVANTSGLASVLGASTRAPMRLLEIGVNGDTLRDRMFVVPTRGVSDNDISLIVDSLAHSNVEIGGKMPYGIAREIRDSLFVPRVWPPTTSVSVGMDGSIWLRQPEAPAKFATYWRLAPNGQELAPVKVPSTLTVMRVSANRLWAIAEGADGGSVVQVHDVVIRTGGR